MRFDFSTSNKIIFGRGTCAEAPTHATNFGTHVFLVIGNSVSYSSKFIDSLKQNNLRITIYRIHGEPTISIIQEGLALIKENKCDLVIGFGGGSILDTGKAIAALATNTGELRDYLEVIGKGKPLISAPLPYIAIPTTSGTGSEVTRNAVIRSPEHGIKVSLRSSLMIPRVAIIDPELTCSVPPNITASTGLDALTQLIEPYISTFSNPFTDCFCRDGMLRVSRSLLQAYKDGNNIRAREDISLASLFSGIALANAGLGVVHGLAGPIGGLIAAPHGAICAALLPNAVRINIEAIKSRSSNPEHLKRYKEIAQILTGEPDAKIEDGITLLNNTIKELEISSLATYGVTKGDFPILIEKAMKSSSMKGNPIELNEAELTAILENSL